MVLEIGLSECLKFLVYLLLSSKRSLVFTPSRYTLEMIDVNKIPITFFTISPSYIEWFANGRKPNSQVITSTNHNRSKQLDEPVSNLLKLLVQDAIGLSYAFHWLKNRCKICFSPL